MTTRRSLLASVPSLSAATLLPGLAQGSDYSDTVATLIRRAKLLADGRDLELEILIPAGSEPNVAAVGARFQEATGVHIKPAATPVDDINSTLILANMRNKPIDLALPATFGLPDLVAANVLLPLDSYLDGVKMPESLYSLGDFVNSRRFGFQTDGDAYVMFYNKALLRDPVLSQQYAERYGHLPVPAKTFSELDRMMAFYHKPAANRFGGCLFRTPLYITWEWWLRLHAKGALPFDRDMRPQIDGAEGVAALEELISASRHLTPTASTDGLTENWKTFSAGNVLCNIGWGGSQKYFRANQQSGEDKFLVANTPGVSATGQVFSYFNWGWSYSIPRTSRHPELAALFACYAAAPGPSTAAVREINGFFDPFHQHHYQDNEIRSVYGDQFLDAHKVAMRSAIPDLYLRGRNEYFEALGNRLLQANRHEISAVNALGAVAERWQQLTQKFGRGRQIERWRALLRSYPPGFLG